MLLSYQHYADFHEPLSEIFCFFGTKSPILQIFLKKKKKSLSFHSKKGYRITLIWIPNNSQQSILSEALYNPLLGAKLSNILVLLTVEDQLSTNTTVTWG